MCDYVHYQEIAIQRNKREGGIERTIKKFEAPDGLDGIDEAELIWLG